MTCTDHDREKWEAAETLGPILDSLVRSLQAKPKARVYQTEIDLEAFWVTEYYTRNGFTAGIPAFSRAVREFATHSAAMEFAHASWYL
jgi:hypothetical protein